MTIITNPIPRISIREHLMATSLDAATGLLNYAEKYGDFVQVRNSPVFYLITDSEAIDHVLKKNMENYTKDFTNYRRLGKLLGDGLLTTMDPFWLHQRRLLQTLFHPPALKELANQTIIATREMFERWDKFATYAQPFDLTMEMLVLVLRISLRFFFNENLTHQQAQQFVREFRVVQQSLQYAFTLNKWVPTIKNIQFHWLRARIEKKCRHMLNKRRAQSEQTWPHDMLSVLLQAQHPETGAPYPEKLILDELITFTATGHETTGNALSWMWYLLAQHPHVLQKLHHQLDDQLPVGLQNAEQLSAVPLVKMIFQETLRLYPTIWSTARLAKQKDEILNVPIKEKTLMLISPYVMHRLSRYWENPHQFIPERFIEENFSKQKRYTYMPFGAGPRSCIANVFSMLKGQIILAMTAARYEFELLPESYSMPVELLITLRPAKPMRFRIKKRDIT